MNLAHVVVAASFRTIVVAVALHPSAATYISSNTLISEAAWLLLVCSAFLLHLAQAKIVFQDFLRAHLVEPFHLLRLVKVGGHCRGSELRLEQGSYSRGC